MKRILGTLGVCLCLWGAHAQDVAPLHPAVQQLYTLTDSLDVQMRQAYKPLIGITAGNRKGRTDVSQEYIDAVMQTGGTPVVIPQLTDGQTLYSFVAQLDGLLLTGSMDDIDPAWYGEQPVAEIHPSDALRDTYELKVIKLASDRNIPILGICRGCQLLNVAFGGTLYQDIPSKKKNSIPHLQQQPEPEPSHQVSVAAGSQLAQLMETTTLQVNSLHHQGVKQVAPGFQAVAYAPDSLVEAIEAWPNRPILGVQHHPESMTMAGDQMMEKLFRFLVGKADTFHLAKEMHKHFLSVDTHTDTPFWFRRPGYSIADREVNRVNLPKMQEGYLDGVFLAAFIWQQKVRDEAHLQAAVEETTRTIQGIYEQAEANADLCGIARTPEEFARLKKEGKKAFFIGIENGFGIGKDLANIAKFKEMGVNYITLCHSYDNDICDSSTHTNREWDGLSPFGEQVVKEMNRLGIMIDLSHAGESSFWDVMKLTRVPVICSHSSARAICDHDRNLTDDQLRALAKNGGVVQLCLLDEYINKEGDKACLMDAIRHIDHIVEVAGIDHVGIGSDFDGGGGIIGCQGDNDLIQITVKLIERGYSAEDIAKIWGGNLMRVMREVQAAAEIH